MVCGTKAGAGAGGAGAALTGPPAAGAYKGKSPWGAPPDLSWMRRGWHAPELQVTSAGSMAVALLKALCPAQLLTEQQWR